MNINLLFNFLATTCLIDPGSDLGWWINFLFNAIRISTPILVLVLISVDIVKAVIAGKEDEIKKAQNDAIKRILIGVVIFFVPTIVNIVLWLANDFSSTCGIGW